MNASDRPACEIRGKEQVAEFFDAIELEPVMEPWCKCTGDVLIEFYDGQRSLAKVSVHHGNRLRWRDGAWLGQAPMTPAGHASLDAWLQSNGCATIDELIDIAHQR